MAYTENAAVLFLTDHRNALAESEKIQNLMGAIFGFLLQSECVFTIP